MTPEHVAGEEPGRTRREPAGPRLRPGRALGERPGRRGRRDRASWAARPSPEFLTSYNFFNAGHQHRRDRDHGAADDADHHQRRDRPVGRLDAGHVQRAARRTCGADHWPMLAIFVGGRAGRRRWPGPINGLLVTRVGLPSLAVTIGTLALYRGSRSSCSARDRVQLPGLLHQRRRSPRARTPILSWSVAIFIVLAVIFGIVLHATAVRPVASTRSVPTPEAALYAGHPGQAGQDQAVRDLRRGLRAGRGALHVPAVHRGAEHRHSAFELDVVTIVLLGGVSIFGGKGSIGGVVLAVFVFAGLQNALLLTNFNQEATGLVTGGLLLISVFVPNAGHVRALPPPGRQDGRPGGCHQNLPYPCHERTPNMRALLRRGAAGRLDARRARRRWPLPPVRQAVPLPRRALRARQGPDPARPSRA